MNHRFEMQRVLSMSSPRGVERIVRSLFVPPPAGTGGAVVLNLRPAPRKKADLPELDTELWGTSP
jgi:hypothetical protein